MCIRDRVHLLADCTWNQAVSDLLDARGEQPSRDFRIKKQGDFDLFGKSLELDLMPRLTPQLIEVAAANQAITPDQLAALKTWSADPQAWSDAH